MWLDWVSNPGPLVLESGALPTALRGLALTIRKHNNGKTKQQHHYMYKGVPIHLKMVLHISIPVYFCPDDYGTLPWQPEQGRGMHENPSE